MGDDIQTVKNIVEENAYLQNLNIQINGLKQSKYTVNYTTKANGIIDITMRYQDFWYGFDTRFYDVCTHYIVKNGKYEYIEEQFPGIPQEQLEKSVRRMGFQQLIGSLYFSETYEHYYKIYTEKDTATWEYHTTDLNKLPENIRSTVEKGLIAGGTKAVIGSRDILRATNTDDFILKPAHYLFIEAEEFSEGLAVVGADEYGEAELKNFGERIMFGYINKTGEFQILPVYASAQPFKDGFAIVQSSYGSSPYFINRKGENQFKQYFREARNFSEGVAVVGGNDGLYGCIDKTGKLITEYRYEIIGDFKNGHARVKRGGKWGFINARGTEVILPQFAEVRDFHEGFVFVEKHADGKEFYQYINSSYNIAFELPREAISQRDVYYLKSNEYYDFHNGVIKIVYYDPRKYFGTREIHYIDTTGRTLNTGKGSMAYFGEDALFVEKAYQGPYSGVKDIKGRWQIKPQFEIIGNFSEGLAKVQLNNNWGYINKNGDVVINKDILKPKGTVLSTYPLKSAEDFSEGLALVKYQDYFGYMNHDGTWVIEPTFYKATSFKDGVARVKIPGRIEWCYIDKTGRIIRPDRR
ncbi:WG repeat-containing protein [Chitinophaga silvatica]|uniref:WG repeat-containing protein n=1 Tax=Chitinophaga silvatica TaxID=2282649 RepID=UPI001314D761|nr:WG repeat-containing protein [Chitinophaga silvatica]